MNRKIFCCMMLALLSFLELKSQPFQFPVGHQEYTSIGWGELAIWHELGDVHAGQGLGWVIALTQDERHGIVFTMKRSFRDAQGTWFQAWGDCLDFEQGGKNDWYLPTSWEFITMSRNPRWITMMQQWRFPQDPPNFWVSDPGNNPNEALMFEGKTGQFRSVPTNTINFYLPFRAW